MASLNQIAERIAYTLGEPLNIVLKENIKFSIKYWRALLYRRDIATNGQSDEFLQKFHAPLTKVDKADDCAFTLDCTILRTTNKVPKPVRLKTDVLFKFVGTADGKAFDYTEYEEVQFRCENKYTGKSIIYSYINDYLYIFNATKLKKLAIQAVFANPEEINICATSDTCYSDDDKYPIADDMIGDIINGILSKEFKLLDAKDLAVSVEPTDLKGR